MKEAFADTRFGRIHYVEAGAGKPILLTHSGGASLHEFEASIERLSKAGRVIAWDLPGHGDSDPFTRHFPVTSYTAATLALMDALHIDRATIVGCSIGGLIAIDMGANHPERVDKTVIVDVQLRTNRWWVDNWAMVEDMFTEVVQPLQTVLKRFKALSAATHRRWNIDRAKCGAKGLMDVVWAARDYDVLAAVARVKTPTLTIIGGAGPSRDCVDDFKRLLPHGKLEVMDGCGHFPMIDEPEAFDAIVANFIQQR